MARCLSCAKTGLQRVLVARRPGVTLRIRRPQYRRGITRSGASTPVKLSKSSLGAVAVLAAAAITPVAAVGIGQVADEAPTSSAADTGVNEVSLSSAPLAEGVPQDVAGGGAQVREVSSETPFSMVGVTWKGEHDATARVRAQQPDGSWGEWFEADSVAGDLDSGQATSDKGGTEPVYLGTETTKVQISLEGVDLDETSIGDAPDALTEAPETSAPGAEEDIAQGEQSQHGENAGNDAAAAGGAIADALAGMMGPGNGNSDVSKPVVDDDGQVAPAADETSLDDPGVDAVLLSPDLNSPAPAPDLNPGEYGDVANPKQPSIISRAGWGANESMRCQSPSYDDSLAAGVVHHTAGSNNYTKDQSAGVVRGIYVYHAQNLGWCDVGYNVLVDKYGQAFEGRAGGLDKNVQGAHAGGFNSNTWGISMMGDFSNINPPDATINKVGEILGWRLALAGIDPKGKANHYSEGTSYTKYPQGTRVNLPNIFAHRDVGLTTCPGDAGYAQMGKIRDIAAKYAKTGGGSSSNTKTTTTSKSGGDSGGSKPTTGRPTSTSEVPTGDSGSLESALGGTGSADLKNLDAKGAAQLIGKLLMNGGQLNLDGLKALNLVETLGSIKSLGTALVQAGGDGRIGKLFAALGGADGVLGKALSGVQKYNDVSYAKFDEGAIYESERTGAHAVVGRIGDAWAAQGFEHGPLGLPTEEETPGDDGSTVSQQFEHGRLVYDLNSGTVKVEG